MYICSKVVCFVRKLLASYLIGLYTKLASHTTHVVGECGINFINGCHNLHFKVYSEEYIFQKHFMGIIFYFQILCQNTTASKSPRKKKKCSVLYLIFLMSELEPWIMHIMGLPSNVFFSTSASFVDGR